MSQNNITPIPSDEFRKQLKGANSENRFAQLKLRPNSWGKLNTTVNNSRNQRGVVISTDIILVYLVYKNLFMSIFTASDGKLYKKRTGNGYGNAHCVIGQRCSKHFWRPSHKGRNRMVGTRHDPTPTARRPLPRWMTH